jgi:glycerate-2-kinase
MDPRLILESLYRVALASVDPYGAVRKYGDYLREVCRRVACEKIYLVGFGKAAAPMAHALYDELGDRIEAGLVITKYGHAGGVVPPPRIEILEAGHPIPDAAGIKGTASILGMVQPASTTLVLCLISGGGSALLIQPRSGITLPDKQRITDLLLKAGASIGELNAIRKHLSQVKGGRLAERFHPSRIISLILSDVIGDRLDTIASGPTAPDGTTYRGALAILEKYDLMASAPAPVLTVFRKGAAGGLPETPKAGDRVFDGVENIIIAGNKIALDTAQSEAQQLGFKASISASALEGEASVAGRWLAQRAIETINETSPDKDGPLCLISGGETTVTVDGDGLGGRNMELALAFAMASEGREGITLLSAGTDGTDGPTDAAGAIVDGQTVARAKGMGIDPADYLKRHDSYNFFRKVGGLLITGPTGTNVMDIQLILITPGST